jgi:hypothetical protein
VPSFPSPQHAAVADAAVEFVSTLPDAEAVSLVGSCARRADANDLDLTVLVSDASAVARVEEAFARFAATSNAVAELAALGPFAEVDLHAITGDFTPGPRDWTSGPDDFEVEIGNEVVYSVALWQREHRLDDLRSRWLPFYDDARRARRLEEARMYALNDLDHVPLMIRRDEPFHAFHRLYLAFRASSRRSSSRGAPIRSPTTSGSVSRSRASSGCPLCTSGCRRSWGSTSST